MHLTRHTDYGLRVLMYLAVTDEERSNVAEIASAYAISRDHLVKVVQRLAAGGFVHTRRGRSGGISLPTDPHEIRIGDVVRHLESGFPIVECMTDLTPGCRISPACGLKSVVNRALTSFLETLDGYTLADCIGDREQVRALLGLSDADGNKTRPPPSRSERAGPGIGLPVFNDRQL